MIPSQAQSYGSKARILMSVVETVSEGEASSTTHAQLTPMHSAMRPTYTNSPVPSAPSTPPPAAIQAATPPVPNTPASVSKNLPSTPYLSVPFFQHWHCIDIGPSFSLCYRSQRTSPTELSECRRHRHFESHGERTNSHPMVEGDL